MRCEYCGRPIQPGEWQCAGCGAPINEADYQRQAEEEAKRQRQEAERQRQAQAERQRQEAERQRQAQAERQRQEAERQKANYHNETHYQLYQRYGEISRNAYGSLTARTVAFLIDAVILSIICAIPVVGALCALAYIVLGDSSIWNGQTIGRHIMHLQVVDMNYATISVKRSICRNICKYLLLYFGDFIFIIFSRRRRSVHDMICGTCVIKTN